MNHPGDIKCHSGIPFGTDPIARYKHIDTSPRFIAVDLERQLHPGTFEHALNYLIDHQIDLSRFDVRYKNDLTGASAYPPAMLLKVVLFAYTGAKGKVIKSNRTDNESAKMATSKGVIQGYCCVAAVDDRHQIIVEAQAHGTGSEQALLMPMVGAASSLCTPDTLITADAGYHSNANLKALAEQDRPALRQRWFHGERSAGVFWLAERSITLDGNNEIGHY